jgi:hypothetical protein
VPRTIKNSADPSFMLCLLRFAVLLIPLAVFVGLFLIVPSSNGKYFFTSRASTFFILTPLPDLVYAEDNNKHKERKKKEFKHGSPPGSMPQALPIYALLLRLMLSSYSQARRA